MVAPLDSGERETTPRGNVGRLPHEVREVVNKMIRDNATAEQIRAFLATRDITNVSPQNISSWKANGYEKWLRQQDRIAASQLRLE